MQKFILPFLTLSIMSSSVWSRCEEKVSLDTIDTKVWYCDDGTISFTQPFSYSGKDKKDDYEGLCGAVAAANVFHAYCDETFIDPVQLGPKYFSDITPGIRPDTLRNGLNKLFRNNSECMTGEWKYYYSANRWDYFGSLNYRLNEGFGNWTRTQENGSSKAISPVLALISKEEDGSVLHWVTVVDLLGYDSSDKESINSENCKVVYNDFGNQSKTSCNTFIKWAHQVDNHIATGWMPEYIHVVFVPSFVHQVAKRAAEFIPPVREIK